MQVADRARPKFPSLPLHVEQASYLSRISSSLHLLVHPDTVSLIMGYAAKVDGKLNWFRDFLETVPEPLGVTPDLDPIRDICQRLMALEDFGGLLTGIQPYMIGQVMSFRNLEDPPTVWHHHLTSSHQAFQNLLISLVGRRWEKCPSGLRFPTEIILAVSSPDVASTTKEHNENAERFYLCLTSMSCIFVFTASYNFSRTIQLWSAIIPCSMSVDGDEILLGDLRTVPSSVVMINAQSGVQKQRYRINPSPSLRDQPISIVAYGSKVFVLVPSVAQIQIFSRSSGQMRRVLDLTVKTPWAPHCLRGSIRIVQGNLIVQFSDLGVKINAFC